MLYRLGPTPGLFTQQDRVPVGTWEPATGLGLVNLDKLLDVFPRGTGSSFVSFAASTYTPSYGSPVTFTSTVTSGTGGGTPSGTVAYVTSTGTTLGTANLDAAGNATYTTAAPLAGGTYSITAQYSGDATYAPATSSPAATLIVQPESVVLTGSVSTTNTVGDTYTVTITGTASNGAGQPAGNVTLNISGTSTSYTQPFTPLGAHTASATFIEPASTVGTLTLAANCAGTASFSCPNAYTGNVTVVKATPTLALSYTPDPPVSGATTTLTAVLGAHGTAPLPTGTVTFYDNGIGLNATSIDNTGRATVTGVTPTASAHSITAVYNGDPNYNTVNVAGASTSKILTSTSLSASSYAIAPGQSVTLTATLSNTAATGTVSFAAATQGILAASVPVANRVATFTSNTLPAGTYTLSATYSGDATYAGSSATAPAPLVVSSATSSLITTTTTLALMPATPQSGLPTNLSATVTPANAGSAPPSGTVSFLNGTTVVGTGILSAGAGSSATATATATFSGAAPLSLTAVYAGDSLYASSSSPALLITPALTPASISLTASPSDGVAGSNVTLTANVAATAAGAIAPTGSVSFYLAGATPHLIGTAALAPQGAAGSIATLFTGAIPAGPQTLYAVYAGDATFLAATSASINIGLVDYGVSFSPASLTLAAGSTGTSVLTITPNGAFSASIALSCLPPPGSLITCSLSQSTLPGSGTATLTVITTAAVTRSIHASTGLTALGASTLAGLLCLFLPRRTRGRLPTLLLAALSIAVLSIAGCATQGTPAGFNPGTPLGTVNLSINTAATTGATAVHHDLNFQVTVQ